MSIFYQNFTALVYAQPPMKYAMALFFTALTGGCIHPDTAARRAQAQAAFAAEDYTGARAAVLTALESDQGDRAMLMLLVRTDLALGDGDGAGRALDRLVASGQTPGHTSEPSALQLTEWRAEAALLRGQSGDMDRILGNDHSATAWRLRAQAALAAQDNGAVSADFQRGMAAMTTDDGFAADRLAADYARFLIDSDDIDGADRVIQAAHRYGPARLDTLLLIGGIAQDRGQFDAAQQAYRAAAQHAPSRPEPLVALADLADLRGHLDQTARYAAQARALSPDQPQVFSLNVRVAAEQGDWGKVRDMLAPREHALDQGGFDAMAYGEALLHLGHAEQARAIYQQALALSPQNPFARLMLAQSCLAANDGAAVLQAIRPLADSVLAGPRELDVAVAAATMAHDPALAGYAARLHAPGLAALNAAATQARAALARRDWSGALIAYRGLPGHDHDPEVLMQMATAETHLGQHDAALRDADQALALDPRNPDMIHMAGLVRLNARRDLPLAQTLLRQALERDPNNRLFQQDFSRAKG